MPTTFDERIAAYRPRLRPCQRYAAGTALRLWQLPHPLQWHPEEPLDIVVPLDASPPRTVGVHGHRLEEKRAATWHIAASAVVDPTAALLGYAAHLTRDQAIVLIEAAVTTATNYPNLLSGRPVPTIDEIGERLRSWRRFPGSQTIRAALPLVRENVESPKETETRLLLTESGLPEPVVQHEVIERGTLIARVDLAYPELKIAIEYEGDGHRIDREQWRRDIHRQRDLEDCGWVVIRLTQDDLAAGRSAFLARVRRAILSRTV